MPEQKPTANFEFAALEHARNYRRALITEFSAHLRGRVLEVGAGVGQITAELLQCHTVSKLVSIEPDPDFCAVLREKFPGHEIVQGTIDSIGHDTGWDCVVSINVLEHIKDDLDELRRYQQLLAANRGVLCLFVPARRELFSRIDADFGHFRRYNRPELQQKLHLAGFTQLRMRYYNFVGYFAWFLSFRVLQSRRFSTWSVRTFDRYIFPVTNWVEVKLCPPPFGQSLIAVAQVD